MLIGVIRSVVLSSPQAAVGIYSEDLTSTMWVYLGFGYLFKIQCSDLDYLFFIFAI